MKKIYPNRKAFEQAYYQKHKAEFRERSLKDFAANRTQRIQQCMARDAEIKLDVLSHYGKDGQLKCCWSGCEVDDPDMLSLDHLNNDGAKDRAQGKAGIKHYRMLKKENYPDGFQTLCHNHQWKKELMRRRGL